MTDPTAPLSAWNQAAYDAAMSYARASLTSAEQLLRLNLETARATLDQASRATRELMSAGDPQQFVQMRAKLAQDKWSRRRPTPRAFTRSSARRSAISPSSSRSR